VEDFVAGGFVERDVVHLVPELGKGVVHALAGAALVT
jgi:hypothetical protein